MWLSACSKALTVEIAAEKSPTMQLAACMSRLQYDHWQQARQGMLSGITSACACCACLIWHQIFKRSEVQLCIVLQFVSNQPVVPLRSECIVYVALVMQYGIDSSNCCRGGHRFQFSLQLLQTDCNTIVRNKNLWACFQVLRRLVHIVHACLPRLSSKIWKLCAPALDWFSTCFTPACCTLAQ